MGAVGLQSSCFFIMPRVLELFFPKVDLSATSRVAKELSSLSVEQVKKNHYSDQGNDKRVNSGNDYSEVWPAEGRDLAEDFSEEQEEEKNRKRKKRKKKKRKKRRKKKRRRMKRPKGRRALTEKEKKDLRNRQQL